MKYYDESRYVEKAAKPANYEMAFEDLNGIVVSTDYLGVYTVSPPLTSDFGIVITRTDLRL